MCCRYYYEDFERELRELMRAEAVVQLPGFDRNKTENRDISPSQAAITIHAAEARGGRPVDTYAAGASGGRLADSIATEAKYGKTGMLGASAMNWGFANPYRKGLVINARAETAREKNLFADSIVKRRCVIPASGFYEWDRYKARYRFTLPGNELIFFAGFFRKEQGDDRYTVLTTDANDSMIMVHDRMPVMIGRDEIRSWIFDDTALPEFLGRKQPELVCEQDSGQIRMNFGL